MKVGILGTGAYGMALSSILVHNCEVTMWTKFEDEKNNLIQTKKNETLLPGFILGDGVVVTTNLEECIQEKDLLIIALPTPFVNELCINMKPYVKDHRILIASKGIEQGSGLFIHEMIENNLDTDKISIISGPSFAQDLIQNMPQGLTIASHDEESLQIIEKAFASENIQFMKTDDVVGVELCGSVKNIMAIGSGILNGMDVNESTKAMFLVEAMSTMKEILAILGCRRETMDSYAGVGDLVLTSTSEKSRNYSFGYDLGKGMTKEEKDHYVQEKTVEGYHTLESIKKLLAKKEKTVPLLEVLYQICFEMVPANTLLKYLANNK